MLFENVGGPNRLEFVWRTDRYQNLSVGEWTRFIDFDHDGDLDLLSERRFSYVQYFRNDGTARAAAFTSVGDSVRDVEGVRSLRIARTFPTSTTSTVMATGIFSSVA